MFGVFNEFVMFRSTWCYLINLASWSLMILFILTLSIQCFLGFPFSLVPSALNSNIILGFLSLSNLFKCPNHLNCLSPIISIILCWSFNILLILSFLIFSYLYFLAAFRQIYILGRKVKYEVRIRIVIIISYKTLIFYTFFQY